MHLQQLENGIGKICESYADISQDIDGAEADLKTLVRQLGHGSVEELDDVSASRKIRLDRGRAGLRALRC